MSKHYSSVVSQLETFLQKGAEQRTLSFQRHVPTPYPRFDSTFRQVVRFLVCPVQPAWDPLVLNTLITDLTYRVEIPTSDISASQLYLSTEKKPTWLSSASREYQEVIGFDVAEGRRGSEWIDPTLGADTVCGDVCKKPLYRVVSVHVFPEKKIIDDLLALEAHPTLPRESWNLLRIPRHIFGENVSDYSI